MTARQALDQDRARLCPLCAAEFCAEWCPNTGR